MFDPADSPQPFFEFHLDLQLGVADTLQVHKNQLLTIKATRIFSLPSILYLPLHLPLSTCEGSCRQIAAGQRSQLCEGRPGLRAWPVQRVPGSSHHPESSYFVCFHEACTQFLFCGSIVQAVFMYMHPWVSHSNTFLSFVRGLLL